MSLFKYIDKNDIKAVKKLIADGGYLNIKNKEGVTALIYASTFDNIKIVKLLIASGANLNLKNEEGNTALIWVSIKNNIKMTKLLIESGADLNIKNDDGKLAVNYYKNKKIFDPTYMKLKKREENLNKILKLI